MVKTPLDAFSYAIFSDIIIASITNLSTFWPNIINLIINNFVIEKISHYFVENNRENGAENA